MFDDESMLRAIYAFYQIYLCLLANVFLLPVKCTFVYYQIYSFYMMNHHISDSHYLIFIISHHLVVGHELLKSCFMASANFVPRGYCCEDRTTVSVPSTLFILSTALSSCCMWAWWVASKVKRSGWMAELGITPISITPARLY